MSFILTSPQPGMFEQEQPDQPPVAVAGQSRVFDRRVDVVPTMALRRLFRLDFEPEARLFGPESDSAPAFAASDAQKSNDDLISLAS